MVNFDAINEILKNYGGSSFYYGSNIPDKKLRNAINAYAPGNQKVYALYDATFLGSAKEGACFTQAAIYYKSGSTVRKIGYEEILSGTIGDGTINGTYCSVFTWCPGLVESIKKVNDPIDLKQARKFISKRDYSQAIHALKLQEKYVRNTPIDDEVVYRYLYIEAYIGLNDYIKAEKLLESFVYQYQNIPKATSLAAEAEKKIAEYKEQYERDLNALKKLFEECEHLCSEKSFDQAIAKLTNVKLRTDFTKEVKCDYYKRLIETYILAEKPDDAEAEINDLYKNDFIDSNEKNSLDGQVCELRKTLHRRFIQEQRELITKRIETAKMYEKYGVYESASDTLIDALSEAPDELVAEKTNLFKQLAEMLMAQYEYDAIYDIGKQYSSITTTEKLGYSLSKKVEQHKCEHIEEYFDHLYSSLIYYMQNGNLERAEYYLNTAKGIKSTFDLRCSEVNLAILKLDYLASRDLIDNLITDRSKYDVATFDETIEQLETQYKNMIASVSEMLKTFVIANDTEALLMNNAYACFVDGDGLNLPCIAARFSNHDVLDFLENNVYGYEFKRTNEGFGIAFLAALQMDYDAFEKFINARMDSCDGDITCVLNEKLDYEFFVSEVVRELRASEGLSEKQARSRAIEAAFNETVFFIASLLDDTTRDEIIGKLNAKKEMQEKRIAQMKIDLPEELNRIDESTKDRCDNLSKAMSELSDLLSDVPEDDDDMYADSVLDELKDAISEATDFAKLTAEKKKAAKKAALETETAFITTIQSRMDAFISIDRSEIVSLLAIPAAAIQTWEYDDEKQSMTFTLMGQSVEVKMSSQLASLITEHSEKLQVSGDVQFEFSGKTLVIKHNYTYSNGKENCSVVFEKDVTISDAMTQDKFVERILGTLKS